ncbi:MAG: methyltransferase domain-containing protein [Planctomycetota bacterium]|jgi:SAM-dependent methyltransferase
MSNFLESATGPVVVVPKSSKKNKRRAKKRGDEPTMAETADIHDLYQRSVQCVESEIDFIDETYEELRGRKATLLREDFCGTANTSCEWIRRRDTNRAIGVDLDDDVLGWGKRHNLAHLDEDGASRIELHLENVLTVETEQVDCLLAMNFSYWLFEKRQELLAYFRRCHEALKDDGVFFLDAYGGYDAPREIEEERDCDGFNYIWDQASFNPVNSHMECKIHFVMPDGSRINNAFEYHWRLWTLPEIREVLSEAGFARSTVYMEGIDEDTDEGDGNFEATELADADAGWIAYIVAEKS